MSKGTVQVRGARHRSGPVAACSPHHQHRCAPGGADSRRQPRHRIGGVRVCGKGSRQRLCCGAMMRDLHLRRRHGCNCNRTDSMMPVNPMPPQVAAKRPRIPVGAADALAVAQTYVQRQHVLPQSAAQVVVLPCTSLATAPPRVINASPVPAKPAFGTTKASSASKLGPWRTPAHPWWSQLCN